jgi:hypothetical protein
MKRIMKWVMDNPSRSMALFVLVMGAIAPIVPVAIITMLSGIASILLGVGVHSVVTPVAKAAEKITIAATEAATEVVKSLDSTIVGASGNVTKAGTEVINNTVDRVVGDLLGGKK